MQPIEPEEERLVRAIAEHHVPELARAQIDPLPSGEGNRSYLLNTGPRHRFIVRLVDELKIHKLRDELRSIEILTRAKVPVPEVVVADLTMARFPVLYRIVRFIEGYDLEEGIATGRVPEEEEPKLGAAWGELMARFHAIRGPTLQKPGLDQGSSETFPALLGRLLSKHLKMAGDAALLDRQRAATLETFFDRALAQLDPRTGGELTHRDLHPRNLIVEERGIGYFVNGIIDLEHCRFWDRLWDFAKLEWFAFERHPSLTEPFLKSYESVWPRPSDFAERTRLYRSAEALISMTHVSPANARDRAFFAHVLDIEMGREKPRD